jgi:voltage-gated potassium channel
MDPGVVHFLEQVLHQEEMDVDIFTVRVPEGSPVVGKPMLGSGIMEEGGAMILAVITADSKLHTNPRPNTTVGPGDALIAMGMHHQLAMLERAVRG